MNKVLVSGAKGFIAGYVIEKLLANGDIVIGIDNNSKYGPIEKSYDNHPNYTFHEGDAKDLDLMIDLIDGCDHFINAAAMIGGISYFHNFAYDLIAENERISATAFDAAIWAHKNSNLKKITVLASSMVYESAKEFPSKEGSEFEIPPPLSTYGFQKLAVEYFVKGAYEQYGLPYTIILPFNAVGTGEQRAKTDVEVTSGNVKLAMSHVIPDLVQKILKGQNPLHILGEGNQVRHYTYAGDLASGIVETLENPAALNDSFNISTPHGHTVKELAHIIWNMIKPDELFKGFVSDKPFEYDVQFRSPSVEKAKKVLGVTCDTSLETALEEVIPWCVTMIKEGKL